MGEVGVVQKVTLGWSLLGSLVGRVAGSPTEAGGLVERGARRGLAEAILAAASSLSLTMFTSSIIEAIASLVGIASLVPVTSLAPVTSLVPVASLAGVPSPGGCAAPEEWVVGSGREWVGRAGLSSTLSVCPALPCSTVQCTGLHCTKIQCTGLQCTKMQ